MQYPSTPNTSFNFLLDGAVSHHVFLEVYFLEYNCPDFITQIS